MNFTKWLLCGLLMVGLLLPVAVQAEVKIAVVDMGDIIFNSPEGKKAQETLKKRGQELGKELERKRDEFGKEIEAFQKQAVVMKEEARKKKEEEFNKKQMELQKQVGASQQELAKLEEKEFKPLYDKFAKVVNQIAKDNGYTVVLDKRMVIGFDPAIDITAKVKEAFGK